MSNGVIIISPDGNVSKLKDKSLDHISSLQKFIKENDLCFPSYEKSNRDILSLYLSGLSYMVILVDYYVDNMYLGESISLSQKNWYLSNINKFKKYSLNVKSIDDSVVSSYELGFEKQSFLMSIINRKKLLDEENKVKKVVL